MSQRESLAKTAAVLHRHPHGRESQPGRQRSKGRHHRHRTPGHGLTEHACEQEQPEEQLPGTETHGPCQGIVGHKAVPAPYVEIFRQFQRRAVRIHAFQPTGDYKARAQQQGRDMTEEVFHIIRVCLIFLPRSARTVSLFFHFPMGCRPVVHNH